MGVNVDGRTSGGATQVGDAGRGTGEAPQAAMQAWELDEGPGRRVLDFSGEPAL